jgi:hypothetical protein
MEHLEAEDECPNCKSGTVGLENGYLVCRGECGAVFQAGSYLYYVTRTWGGDDANPSDFTVTKLTEPGVISLIASIDLLETLKSNHDVDEIRTMDWSTDFVASGWELTDGEEDPRCVVTKARLCDVSEGDAERVFITEIPHSLKQALADCYMRSEEGKLVRMDSQERVTCSLGIYWQGRPRYSEADIETIALSKKDLVQVKDWLATARHVNG